MPGFRAERFEPGKAATDFLPGDFILTHRDHVLSRMIRLAERVRGREQKYSYWSHAAIIVADDGSLVEAESLVGQPFGLLDLVSAGLSLFTGAKLNVPYASHLMCSALVARALERTDPIFADEPAHMLPADLARLYGVEAPRD